MKKIKESCMKRIGRIVLTITIFAIGIVVGMLPAEAAEIVLKLGHVGTSEHAFHVASVRLSELVAKQTNGRVDIQVFHSGQLGNERDMVEGMQLGTVDMGFIATGSLAGFEPKYKVFDLPFLFRDENHVHKVLDGTVGKKLSDLAEGKGLKVLAYGESGFRHMVNRKKPLFVPGDMRGLKMRVIENPIYLATFRALGTNATPMAFGEVYTALQQGIIDGLDFPINAVGQHKFYEVTKYLSLTRHVFLPMAFMISIKKWNSLPTDIQKIMLESAKEAVEYERQLIKQQDNSYIPIITKAGMKINEVKRELWVEATRSVYKEFGENIGTDLIDKIRNIH